MQYPYILTSNTFTVFIDGDDYATDRSNPSWDKIKEEVNKDVADKNLLLSLIKPITAVAAAVKDILDISVRNGAVYYGEDRIHDNLAKRMLDVLAEDLSLEPWKRFTANVFANPRVFAKQELYDFLEKCDLPITPDGCFLAYKVVSNDYKDLHTRTMDNSVGKVVELPGGADAVDPDRHNTCSRGLHFCSKGYLDSFGNSSSKVMLVKVNPADVVAIPVDYNHAKGRTWRYEVIQELPSKAFAKSKEWGAVAQNADDSDWDAQNITEDANSYYVN